jgi:hypothetical protein
MALSAAFVDSHIADWQQRLTSPFYPHRKHWPANLFHHAPIENAVAILQDGHLRSRNDAGNQHPKDVAAPGVIDARDHAHSRVRLYFRPKTPTQWHIEGIRKAGECNYGDPTHAAVLVMFALDAKVILTRPDIMFSNQNMQLANTESGSDEAYFSQIPFLKVFSEGSTGGDRSYTDARCAEVLPNSPLNLRTCLRAIYFRSEPERDTLLYMLGANRNEWEDFCHVSDALKVFQKDYTFVQEIRLTNDGVVFRLNPRRDLKNISLKIDVWDTNGRNIVNFFNSDHAPRPNPPASNWIWRPHPSPHFVAD